MCLWLWCKKRFFASLLLQLKTKSKVERERETSGTIQVSPRRGEKMSRKQNIHVPCKHYKIKISIYISWKSQTVKVPVATPPLPPPPLYTIAELRFSCRRGENMFEGQNIYIWNALKKLKMLWGPSTLFLHIDMDRFREKRWEKMKKDGILWV